MNHLVLLTPGDEGTTHLSLVKAVVLKQPDLLPFIDTALSDQLEQ